MMCQGILLEANPGECIQFDIIICWIYFAKI